MYFASRTIDAQGGALVAPRTKLLDTVHAETFHDKAPGGGATEPSLLLCRNGSGDLVSVFAKVAWQGCSVEGLVREVICYLLALDLGLNVPECVFVEYDQAFVDALSAVRPGMGERFASSPSPAFGSVYLGTDFTDCSPTSECPTQALVEVWAFDHLILNPDRRQLKPNSLTDGTKIVLIDHEKALNCAMLGSLFAPYPWEGGAISAMEMSSPHLFGRRLSKADGDLSRLQAAWGTLTPETFEKYRAAIPAAWKVDSKMLEETFGYLDALRVNVDEAFAKLREAMP